MWVLIRLNVITLKVELPDAQYLRMREDVTYKIKIISEILANARNAGLLPNLQEKVKLLGFGPADNPLEESGSASTSQADRTNSTPANRPADNPSVESGSVQTPLADRTNSTPANREVLPSFKWGSSSVKLLLKLRWEKEEQFARPPFAKNKLWASIANSMAEQGYLVSGPACDAKYRNLKSTYQTIRLRLLQTGEAREVDGKAEESPSWEFYTLFRDNIGAKASVEPDEGLLGGTFDQTENQADTSCRKVSSPEEGTTGFLKGKRKRVKKQPELTVKQYLHQKNAQDEQRAEQQRELMAQRLELRRRRLELEEERIRVERERTAAIERLAEAVEARRSAGKSIGDENLFSRRSYLDE